MLSPGGNELLGSVADFKLPCVMSDLTLKDYTQLLRKSDLLSLAQVDATLREFQSSRLDDGHSNGVTELRADSSEDALAFANFLKEREVVTEWQNRNLLQGRHKGLKFGKFRILQLLGVGGMGRVFLAEDEMLKRKVALKVLPKARGANERALQRFHQEARALAQLDHPNIVRVHDVDYRERTHYIVMEFVQGTDLAKRVGREGPLGEQVALNYLRQTAIGLEHAHQSGLIHRDVKPANLLVDQSDTIKILDLGLALLQSDDEGGITVDPTRTLGTVDFISPEQALHSRNLDHRSDLYSLGCTLFFLLTTRAPFSNGPMAQRLLAHQNQEPPSINSLREALSEAAISEGTQDLCHRLMAKSPQDRPDSAAEVVSLIDSIQEPSGQLGPSEQAADTRSPDAHSTLAEVSNHEAGSLSSAIQIQVGDSDAAASGAARRNSPRASRKRANRNWVLLGSSAVCLAGLTAMVFLLTRSPNPGRSDADAGGRPATTRNEVDAQSPSAGFWVVGNGTKFHRHDCQFVTREGAELRRIENPEDTGLEPCKLCNPLR
ncbi:MAG: serine/threonine-protein kinase [Planctomycetota bacterium]